jgi:hypothetical protein
MWQAQLTERRAAIHWHHLRMQKMKTARSRKDEMLLGKQ